MKWLTERVTQLVKGHMIAWGVLTIVFYVVAIPLTVWVFPATTLIVTVLILFTGFTSSVAALGAALMSADQAEKAEESSADEE